MSNEGNTSHDIAKGCVTEMHTPIRNNGDVNYHTAQLQESKVTHVVNCTPGFPFPTAEQMGGKKY